MLGPTVSRPVCSGVKPPLGPKTRFLLLSDSCGFVDMGRHLWREDGTVVYICCWSSPTQSFSGTSPTGPMTVFYSPRFETPPTWRARSPYLFPLDTGFLFHCLWLAELRCRYSNPPPRWDDRLTGKSESESKLLNDWRYIASQFVLAWSSFRRTTREKTPLPTVLLLFSPCLLPPSTDGYWAIAWQRPCLQGRSEATTVSAGLTILTFSRYATILFP
jgi:hypothetical protein